MLKRSETSDSSAEYEYMNAPVYTYVTNPQFSSGLPYFHRITLCMFIYFVSMHEDNKVCYVFFFY